jgi:hypothetical protein
MAETIEVIETRIVPVGKPGMMIVKTPNGMLIQAPYEVWIAAIMGQLTDVQQAALCDRVARMTLEHNAKSDNLIDARQLSISESIRNGGSS